MNVKKLSRGPDLDQERYIENAGGNRFQLVIMAAIRARELVKQHQNSGSKEHINATVSALFDFQNGKIGPEYIKRVK